MKLAILKQLPANLYSAVGMELFERLAYYGMFLVLSVYFMENLGIPADIYGIAVPGLFTAMLYLFPLISGALADRFGYKPALMIAFALLTTGYALLGSFTSFPMLALALALIAVGGSIVKPTIAGTVTRTTQEGSTRAVGFGLYYMMVNAGGLIGPVLAAQIRDRTEFRYVFWASAIACGLMFVQASFAFREPVADGEARESVREKIKKSVEIAYSWLLLLVLDYGPRKRGMERLLSFLFLLPWSLLPAATRARLCTPQRVGYLILVPWSVVYGLLLRSLSAERRQIIILLLVLLPWWLLFPSIWTDRRQRDSDTSTARFLLLLVVFSGFWGMFNAFFAFMPHYFEQYTDLRGAQQAIDRVIPLTRWFGNWLKGEVFLSLDSLLIVLLQATLSYLTRRWKTVSAMLVGTAVATLSWSFPALSSMVLIVALGIAMWSIGEMICSARFFQYCGTVAPKDQVAVYLGYSFFSISIGNLYSGPWGGWLYERFVHGPAEAGRAATPELFFAGVMAMGVVSAIGLALYARFVAPSGAGKSREEAR